MQSNETVSLSWIIARHMMAVIKLCVVLAFLVKEGYQCTCTFLMFLYI
jgi:hypothetical protein